MLQKVVIMYFKNRPESFGKLQFGIGCTTEIDLTGAIWAITLAGWITLMRIYFSIASVSTLVTISLVI